MKRLLIAFSAALVLLSSCVTSQKSLKESKPVAFVEARNYFHIGDETKPVILKITSKTEFERQFGEAAFMGKGENLLILTLIRVLLLPISCLRLVLKQTSDLCHSARLVRRNCF